MHKILAPLILAAATSLAHAQPTEAVAIPSLDQCTSFGQTLLNAPYSDDIAAKAKEHKLTVRVVSRDQERFPVTMDYRIDRVNLHLKDGKVIKAICG
ncbi:hypothetical protein WJ96_06870 [Burkholderia ubonensis]|uniref:Peptidase inhibitor I78 family protein n=1 Tax=Burkholderia ubonensis TaxID=101571 RepID=A0AAW3MRM2_9BURK|nr:hypothetical protein [Burkholderia ubonensis]KVP75426.1 hypothetical protein WJ93_08665 [Burkholderia ubonensis]KVP98239.1 hypothetical protein WJ96_06870 [Burkholderia ubonensis]KVZ92936.1 hypothetical protein WL25_18530 [Burkholderia ubonensis]